MQSVSFNITDQSNHELSEIQEDNYFLKEQNFKLFFDLNRINKL